MDVVFLDANLLFSAAYRPNAGVLRLWQLEGVDLVTSAYAAEAARRNLAQPAQQERLVRLLEPVRIVPEAADRPLPSAIRLPEKDRPILLAAAAAGATHLLTGDATHFGPYFDRRVEQVLILTPSQYLKHREPREESDL